MALAVQTSEEQAVLAAEVAEVEPHKLAEQGHQVRATPEETGVRLHLLTVLAVEEVRGRWVEMEAVLPWVQEEQGQRTPLRGLASLVAVVVVVVYLVTAVLVLVREVLAGEAQEATMPLVLMEQPTPEVVVAARERPTRKRAMEAPALSSSPTSRPTTALAREERLRPTERTPSTSSLQAEPSRSSRLRRRTPTQASSTVSSNMQYVIEIPDEIDADFRKGCADPQGYFAQLVSEVAMTQRRSDALSAAPKLVEADSSTVKVGTSTEVIPPEKIEDIPIVEAPADRPTNLFS